MTESMIFFFVALDFLIIAQIQLHNFKIFCCL